MINMGILVVQCDICGIVIDGTTDDGLWHYVDDGLLCQICFEQEEIPVRQSDQEVFVITDRVARNAIENKNNVDEGVFSQE